MRANLGYKARGLEQSDAFGSSKVHLLISVFLTDKTLSGAVSYGSNVSSTQNKVDQFLSVIHSISRLKFASGDVYVSFDEEYRWAEEITLRTIADTFPFARIFRARLETFDGWKAAGERIPSEVTTILLKTNHDHAFVHESVEEFETFTHRLASLGDRFVGAVTHWPESVDRDDLVYMDNPPGQIPYFLTSTTWTIGTCLVSKILFLEWWEKDFTGNSRIIRPDNPFGPSVEFSPCIYVVPTAEFFRHLDGYGHSKVRAPVAGPLRACCVVDNDQVRHRGWVRGFFLLGDRGAELPFLPQEHENSIGRCINLLLLASSHSINFRNLKRLLNSNRRFCQKFGLLIIPSLLLNRFMLGKLPRTLLRYFGILRFLRLAQTQLIRITRAVKN